MAAKLWALRAGTAGRVWPPVPSPETGPDPVSSGSSAGPVSSGCGLWAPAFVSPVWAWPPSSWTWDPAPVSSC